MNDDTVTKIWMCLDAMEETTDDNSESKQTPFAYGWGNDKENVSSSLSGFVTILSSCGLFYKRNILTKEAKENDSKQQKLPTKQIFQLCLCVLAVALLLFNCTRMTVSVFVGHHLVESRSIRILNAGWTFLCLMNGIISISWSVKIDGLESILKQWTQNQQAFRHIGIQTDRKKSLRNSRLFLTISAVIVSVNIVALGLLTFINIESDTLIFEYVSTGPFKPTVTSKVCFIVLNVINSISWVFPMLFFVLICLNMKDEVVLYNNNLDYIITRKSGSIGHDLARLRRGHVELCKTVSAIDECFRLALLVWISSFIALGSYCGYILIKTRLDSFGYCVFIFWLSTDIFGLGIITTFAAIIHEEVLFF